MMNVLRHKRLHLAERVIGRPPVSGTEKGAASSRRLRARKDTHPPFDKYRSAGQIESEASFLDEERQAGAKVLAHTFL